MLKSRPLVSLSLCLALVSSTALAQFEDGQYGFMTLETLDGTVLGAVKLGVGAAGYSEAGGYDYRGFELWDWYSAPFPAESFIMRAGADAPRSDESLVFHQAQFPGTAKEDVFKPPSESARAYDILRCDDYECELVAYLVVEPGHHLSWYAAYTFIDDIIRVESGQHIRFEYRTELFEIHGPLSAIIQSPYSP